MQKIINKIIVLAYGSPLENSGYGIALNSSLRQYARLADKVYFICASEAPVNLGDLKEIQNISSTWIPIKRLPIPFRFFLGCTKKVPAVGVEFRQARVIRALKQELRTLTQTGSSVIVFEDIPIALLNKELFPAINRKTSKVVLRSHNVMSKAFLGLLQFASPSMRLFWGWEISKLTSWERKTLQNMDRVWAISPADKDTYYSQLGINCDGVFGIEIDTQRYSDLPAESNETIVYIGSTNIGKKNGLELFIKSVWPKLKMQVPQAQLVFAGTGTEIFSDPVNGINGFGHVNDDRSIIAKGQIFINPQVSGTGVKLKSIIAMAAGRSLVSTDIGLEGVVGNHQEHFIRVSSVLEMTNYLLALMKDREQARNMGIRARQIAVNNYSKGTLDSGVDKLFQELLED